MKIGKEIYMYLLGAIIVAGFFFMINVVFRHEIPQANRDLANILLGALVAKFSDVVGYFFGSSKGSADKTEIINKKEEAKAP